MSNYSEVLDLAKALTGNEHLYSLQPFIKIAGDTTIGLFLERVVYWSDKSSSSDLKRLKIFYKSAEEWHEELGLSYAQITRARKELEALGFITTKRRKVGTNGPPTLHYYANIEAIKQAINQYYSDSGYANLDNSEIQESLNSEKSQGEIQESLKSIEIQESESSSLKDKSNNPINNSRGESPPPKQKGQREIVILAFKVFVGITDYYAITKHWQSEMARIVGDKPEDLEFWRLVVIGWTGKYPTKHNVEGMLDFYKRREIPGYQQPQNGAKPHGAYQRNDKQLTGHDSKSRGTYDKDTCEYVLPDGTRVPIVNDPG